MEENKTLEEKAQVKTKKNAELKAKNDALYDKKNITNIEQVVKHYGDSDKRKVIHIITYEHKNEDNKKVVIAKKSKLVGLLRGNHVIFDRGIDFKKMGK